MWGLGGDGVIGNSGRNVAQAHTLTLALFGLPQVNQLKVYHDGQQLEWLVEERRLLPPETYAQVAEEYARLTGKGKREQ